MKHETKFKYNDKVVTIDGKQKGELIDIQPQGFINRVPVYLYIMHTIDKGLVYVQERHIRLLKDDEV